MIDELAPEALQQWMADATRVAPIVIDVRDDWELEICKLPGARSVPMHEVAERLDEIPRDHDLVLVCHHGMRSLHIARFLAESGYTRLFNLSGGIAAWAETVDPAMPVY